MDERIAEQVESLLGTHVSTRSMGRNLVTLSGFLADQGIPEETSAQLERLSRLLVLQEIFDSLVQTLGSNARYLRAPRMNADAQDQQSITSDFANLLEKVDHLRQDIMALEPINYSVLIAWVVTRAREQKILKSRGRR